MRMYPKNVLLESREGDGGSWSGSSWGTPKKELVFHPLESHNINGLEIKKAFEIVKDLFIEKDKEVKELQDKLNKLEETKQALIDENKELKEKLGMVSLTC